MPSGPSCAQRSTPPPTSEGDHGPGRIDDAHVRARQPFVLRYLPVQVLHAQLHAQHGAVRGSRAHRQAVEQERPVQRAVRLRGDRLILPEKRLFMHLPPRIQRQRLSVSEVLLKIFLRRILALRGEHVIALQQVDVQAAHIAGSKADLRKPFDHRHVEVSALRAAPHALLGDQAVELRVERQLHAPLLQHLERVVKGRAQRFQAGVVRPLDFAGQNLVGLKRRNRLGDCR